MSARERCDRNRNAGQRERARREGRVERRQSANALGYSAKVEEKGKSCPFFWELLRNSGACTWAHGHPHTRAHMHRHEASAFLGAKAKAMQWLCVRICICVCVRCVHRAV